MPKKLIHLSESELEKVFENIPLNREVLIVKERLLECFKPKEIKPIENTCKHSEYFFQCVHYRNQADGCAQCTKTFYNRNHKPNTLK